MQIPRMRLLQRARLKNVAARLRALYGPPSRPLTTDPFELILLENCAYLVDDERRRTVFTRLKRQVGTTPAAILGRSTAQLADIIRDGGMRPPMRAAKLHSAAHIALDIGLAKLRAAVRRSPKEAKQLLQRFPGIAEPGADKILLFAGGQVSLGPDSNALRVLYRLGFGKQEKDYGRTYRSAAEAVRPELPRNFRWLIRAHQLLRRHGQETCKRAAPHCEACPLTASCCWFKEHGGRSGVAEQ